RRPPAEAARSQASRGTVPTAPNQPRARAVRTSWTEFFAAPFRSRFWRKTSTVFGLIWSWLAISREVHPSATSFSTSFSRGVSSRSLRVVLSISYSSPALPVQQGAARTRANRVPTSDSGAKYVCLRDLPLNIAGRSEPLRRFRRESPPYSRVGAPRPPGRGLPVQVRHVGCTLGEA